MDEDSHLLSPDLRLHHEAHLPAAPHRRDTAISDILKLRGEDCRAATEDVLDDLFGHFSGQIHSAFIYGVVVYVWVTTESPRQDELRQILVRYLSTEHHRLGRFKAQCTNPTTASVTIADFEATYTEAQLQALPGFQLASSDCTQSSLRSGSSQRGLSYSSVQLIQWRRSPSRSLQTQRSTSLGRSSPDSPQARQSRSFVAG